LLFNLRSCAAPRYELDRKSDLAGVMAKTSHGSKGKNSLRQKRDRRKTSLENKSHEFSQLCGADFCLVIRIRDSGQVFIFSADQSGFWSFLRSQLVCQGRISPAF
jgi:hypothetical protein